MFFSTECRTTRFHNFKHDILKFHTLSQKAWVGLWVVVPSWNCAFISPYFFVSSLNVRLGGSHSSLSLSFFFSLNHCVNCRNGKARETKAIWHLPFTFTVGPCTHTLLRAAPSFTNSFHFFQLVYTDSRNPYHWFIKESLFILFCEHVFFFFFFGSLHPFILPLVLTPIIQTIFL